MRVPTLEEWQESRSTSAYEVNRMLSPKQIASYLNMNPVVVQRWLREDRVIPKQYKRKLGSKWRVSSKWLDTLDNDTQQAHMEEQKNDNV